MASLTVRDIEDDVKERLRVRAARHGRSMEEEVRAILRQAVGGASGPALLAAAQALFGPTHGVELEIAPRGTDRPALDFSDPDPGA